MSISRWVKITAESAVSIFFTSAARRHERPEFRRVLAAILSALMLMGCSGAVEIPRDDVDDAKYHKEGSYRIRLKGREEYLARRFSVTDSTIVIEDLMPSDERYRYGREDLPIEISNDRVQSIGVIGLDSWGTLAIGLGIGALAAFIIILATADFSID